MATGTPCRRTRRATKRVTGGSALDGPCRERLTCVRDDEGLDGFAGEQCPPLTSAGRIRFPLGCREGLASEPATALRPTDPGFIWWLVDSTPQRGARGLLDATGR